MTTKGCSSCGGQNVSSISSATSQYATMSSITPVVPVVSQVTSLCSSHTPAPTSPFPDPSPTIPSTTPSGFCAPSVPSSPFPDPNPSTAPEVIAQSEKTFNEYIVRLHKTLGTYSVQINALVESKDVSVRGEISSKVSLLEEKINSTLTTISFDLNKLKEESAQRKAYEEQVRQVSQQALQQQPYIKIVDVNKTIYLSSNYILGMIKVDDAITIFTLDSIDTTHSSVIAYNITGGATVFADIIGNIRGRKITFDLDKAVIFVAMNFIRDYSVKGPDVMLNGSKVFGITFHNSEGALDACELLNSREDLIISSHKITEHDSESGYLEIV